MPFYLSWASDLAGLDVPLKQMPTEFVPIPPAMASRPSFAGHDIVTGLEGRIATFNEITQAKYYDLYIRSGGRGVPSVAGFIRCPVIDDDVLIQTWGDFSCIIHRPRYEFRQHKMWDIRYDLVVQITDMDFVRNSVLGTP